MVGLLNRPARNQKSGDWGISPKIIPIAIRPHGLVLQLHLCCRYGPLLGECGRGGASMSVAVWSGSLVAWERELAALKARIGPVFGRAEVRATAGAFLDGLLSGSRAKQAGSWPSRRVWTGPTACSRCWGAAAGMRMPCAIASALT